MAQEIGPNPREKTIVNRFYTIKNNFDTSDYPVAEDMEVSVCDGVSLSTAMKVLQDVTLDLIQVGTKEERALAREMLESPCNKGWYIKLEAGEKVVSKPLTFGGIVFYTTYTPGAATGVVVGDPCDAPASSSGTARLYAVNYKTGGASLDLSTETEYNGDGEIVDRGKKDRYKEWNTNELPPPPVIVIPKDDPPVIIVGTLVIETEPRPGVDMFYWRKVQD